MTETFKNLMIFYCMDTPEWVKWVAIDFDGELWGYSHKPHVSIEDAEWLPTESNVHNREEWTIKDFPEIPEDIDWKETLVEL